MKKEDAVQLMLDFYGAEPEYPFHSAPDTACFRHPRNKKWSALLLGSLSRRCLGMEAEGEAPVINLKCDPLLIPSLIDGEKVFRAYHMNKEHWISVLLDSPITHEELIFLTDISYQLVGGSSKGKK
ncbi:MAG: MmcQ/YjbR family DNA-binding protein [Clostridia bacterium]|nr:MmcQ/YjbR family DNA-binding protein [Clostridia bacterium]